MSDPLGIPAQRIAVAPSPLKCIREHIALAQMEASRLGTDILGTEIGHHGFGIAEPVEKRGRIVVRALEIMGGARSRQAAEQSGRIRHLDAMADQCRVETFYS